MHPTFQSRAFVTAPAPWTGDAFAEAHKLALRIAAKSPLSLIGR